MEVGNQVYSLKHSPPHPRQREKSSPGRLTQKSGVGSQAQLLSGSPIKLSLFFHGVGLKGKEYNSREVPPH